MQQQRTHSVLGVAPLLELARVRNLDTQRLLHDARIPPSLFDDPRATISLESEFALVRSLLEQTGDPALGLEAGRYYHLVSLGLLGAAISAATTLREGIRLTLAHVDLTYTPFAVTFEELGNEGVLTIVDDLELGLLRRFYLDRDVGFVLETARALWPDSYAAFLQHLDIDYPEPAEAARYRAALPCPVTFGAPITRCVVDLTADHPRKDRNALAFRLLEEQLLSSLGRRAENADLGDRVRREIAISVTTRGRWPDQREISISLAIPERTLRRHLEGEGDTFRGALDDVLSRLARRHLEQSTLPVAAVAERLGYAETASFVRAFRRWTGETPRSYRTKRTPS